jgi:glycosyltransferase involved in cell wall biosynthesis
VLLTIAIPAFDEVQNIENAVHEAHNAAKRSAPGDAEILIVDDGSRDGTGAVADRLATELPEVRVVHHSGNRGFTGAMATCFREARGDWIFLAPADGQIAMSEVGRFLEVIPRADIVVGVRELRVEGAGRKTLSRGFHVIARLLFGLDIPEFSSVFLFRRSLLASMRFRSARRSAALLPEILFRARRRGARFVLLTVVQHPRTAGRAKGGQLSVAALTGAELLRVALLSRLDEHGVQKVARVRPDSAR